MSTENQKTKCTEDLQEVRTENQRQEGNTKTITEGEDMSTLNNLLSQIIRQSEKGQPAK